jgi:hypothetical protein
VLGKTSASTATDHDNTVDVRALKNIWKIVQKLLNVPMLESEIGPKSFVEVLKQPNVSL